MEGRFKEQIQELEKLINVEIYLGLITGIIMFIGASLATVRVMRGTRSPFAIVLLSFTMLQVFY